MDHRKAAGKMGYNRDEAIGWGGAKKVQLNVNLPEGYGV
ncbi:hypothetical protein EHW99_1038 [Erwinia amylovora]|uniref:Uncharacterized protein n=2 Tax=Erwinia amylovora TaxID=552 RepID=A0A831A369_ERWAM|nr:hypothetical protein EaACW_2577 [Erwinia amylovora ACW56400]QJQ53745.1 hypothetical protein EHX00_1038 [Erwinia amylovora]CBA21958.1 hypothetical protein predicted by Glimmer/Critica [Erwinia amylovora CFBP1430]CCO79421.1 hypothetical protein BN432_2642 [Erwinia amylovora Ea356]CCO83224.1 hypothetical protein BN433_2665 [Erwinia amylovora Ea266]CCO90781.1 hypothetical protein BN435_2629 [Erwinia amylovora 01SFR-BO]CCO94563.1 hypothetical protein BN437_2653 [Erwinia amylovora NBRC 12687 = C